MIESISPITLWLVIGIIFIIVEMFLPGFIIGFFGLGAIVTCLVTWIGVTKGFTSQMLVFFATSVVSLVLFHKVWKKIKKPIDKGETTNFNIEIGKIVPVTEFIDPLEAGGKVKYQGAIWSATSNTTIPPGESVKVVGCNNLTLIVEKLN